MNKKFIKVSLIICVPLLLILGLFSVTAKNEADSDVWEDEIQIVYNGYKEDKYSHIVSIIVKNKSKNIASMSEMQLSFDYKGEGNDVGDFYIKGYEKDLWSEDRVMGINPGEEEEFIFKIPKGIQIDKETYNLNRLLIDYKASFFKFRTRPNSLFLGIGQMGGTQTIGEGY